MRDKQTLIRITKRTNQKISKLAREKGLANVTVLEYLLNGKISISELDKKNNKNI